MLSTTGFCQVTLKLPAAGREFEALLELAETFAGALGESAACAGKIPPISKLNIPKKTTPIRLFTMEYRSRSYVLSSLTTAE